MDIRTYIEDTCVQARAASRSLAQLPEAAKNGALLLMADLLERSFDGIEAANLKDLDSGRRAGLSAVLLDRLELNVKRTRLMSEGLRQVAALPDPVGDIIEAWSRPNGMQIEKVRVPIGVIAIIYESRPNVTVDAAGLCFKSGNAVILRGGSEALHTNLELARILAQALESSGIDRDVIQIVRTADRRAVGDLLKMNQYVDLVIPRGGEGLIRAVAEQTTIPVIKHYKGVCHVFIDESADPVMARRIVLNAKTQRPATCNAAETLLVHEKLKDTFLREILGDLKANGVQIRGCPQTCAVDASVIPATEEDWSTEYLDMILSVKVVKDVSEAVQHINRYGSMHSDSIVASNDLAAREFLSAVDSACVYHNVSTRFTDGFEFGFGAEIGISTDKIHARGPMGLKELTSYKFIVRGNGQLRT